MFPLEGSGTHLDGPDPHPFPSSHLLLLITNTIYPLHNLPLPLSAHPCVDLGTPCWSLASTPPSPECPTGVEQDLGALTLPQDIGLESSVWGRAHRCSWVEKICGQNQCIGTLMERSGRFGNFTFSSFFLLEPSEGLTTGEKQHPSTLLGERDSSFLQLLRQNMTQSIFIWWVLLNILHSPMCHLLELSAIENYLCDLCKDSTS